MTIMPFYLLYSIVIFPDEDRRSCLALWSEGGRGFADPVYAYVILCGSGMRNKKIDSKTSRERAIAEHCEPSRTKETLISSLAIFPQTLGHDSPKRSISVISPLASFLILNVIIPKRGELPEGVWCYNRGKTQYFSLGLCRCDYGGKVCSLVHPHL